MKRNIIGLMMALLMIVAITGCGGGDDRSLIQTQIVSDAGVDGDIVEDLAGIRTLTLVGRDAVPGVLTGVDPVNGDVYRAFLDFPLGGSVPLNAIIQSATLSIVIRSVTVIPPTGSVPIRIELVSFDPPLVTSDFDRTLLLPLATTTIVPPISSADVNREVNVDVTSLMTEAQFRKLPSFQVRIMQENDFLSSVPGLVEIDESSDANAPVLTVVYF